MVENKKYVTAKVVSKKVVAEGKVTILEIENADVPSISYFTKTFDGKPQYEFITEGNTYDLTYYKKDEYYNLLNAEEVKGEQKTFSNTFKPELPDKDRRISRMAAINSAIATADLEFKCNTLDTKDLKNYIIELASLYEQWVYR